MRNNEAPQADTQREMLKIYLDGFVRGHIRPARELFKLEMCLSESHSRKQTPPMLFQIEQPVCCPHCDQIVDHLDNSKTTELGGDLRAYAFFTVEAVLQSANDKVMGVFCRPICNIGRQV